MASRTGAARNILVTLTDERLKLTNEVLQGIRVVKLYCWEKPIREMIEQVGVCSTYLPTYLGLFFLSVFLIFFTSARTAVVSGISHRPPNPYIPLPPNY